MTEPSPRQVLYALVAAGFLLVVMILVIGAAVAGLTPPWWTATMSTLVIVAGVWCGLHWRRTGPVLLGSIAIFLLWAIGTLGSGRDLSPRGSSPFWHGRASQRQPGV